MTIVPFTTPNFYLNVEFDWIPFFYWITISIALAKLHNKMSTEYLHLTANEKGKWAKRQTNRKRAEGLSCLKMADSHVASMVFATLAADVARRTPACQGEDQTATRMPRL